MNERVKAMPQARSRLWFLHSIPIGKLNALAWIAFGLGALYVRWIFQDDFVRALGFTLIVESGGFLMSLALWRMYERLGIAFGLRTGIWVAFASLVASALLACFAHLVAELTGWHNLKFTHLENAMLRGILMWIVFLCWSFAYFWLRTGIALRSETRIASAAVQEAHRMELQMLRAQLDPHFLFNSLNGIAAEISPHPDSAREMVRKLSLYLRYSLDHRRRSTSPLADEMNAMSCYLDIEKARFGDRLDFAIQATEEARWRLVPSFLLQPLVENAIKHGLLESRQTLKLSITAAAAGDLLEISVSNSGHLTTPEAHSTRLGLETLRRRLDLHYPRRHVFELVGEGETVRAALKLQGDPCCA